VLWSSRTSRECALTRRYLEHSPSRYGRGSSSTSTIPTPKAGDDELTELRDLRRQNADLRERVGQAGATAEAREAELERALHIVDWLTHAIGAAPNDEPQRVIVHDAIMAAEQPVVVVDDAPIEDVEAPAEPLVDEPLTFVCTAAPEAVGSSARKSLSRRRGDRLRLIPGPLHRPARSVGHAQARRAVATRTT